MAPITYVVGAFFLFIQNLMDNQNQSQATSTSPKVAVVDADTSARITSLRFLLMVLIVFLHSYVEVPNEPFASHFVRTAFAGVFTRCGVPLFFFISAFLLFSKNDPLPIGTEEEGPFHSVALCGVDGFCAGGLLCLAITAGHVRIFYPHQPHHPQLLLQRLVLFVCGHIPHAQSLSFRLSVLVSPRFNAAFPAGPHCQDIGFTIPISGDNPRSVRLVQQSQLAAAFV